MKELIIPKVIVKRVGRRIVYGFVTTDSHTKSPKKDESRIPKQTKLEVSVVREQEIQEISPGSLESLYLDGSCVHSRYLVRINGKDFPLRGKSFLYLISLAFNRARGGDDGLVKKTDVEAGENQIKYFYQLKRELRRASLDYGSIVENNGLGSYRLAVDPKIICFNEGRLRQSDDARISGLFVQQALP